MVELKSDLVVARPQIRSVLDTMAAMNGSGGVLPFSVLSTLLGSQDLTPEQIAGFAVRGDLRVAPTMNFVNDTGADTIIKAVKIPGVHGVTDLHIAPMVSGQFNEVTRERLVMTFNEGFTGKTFVKGIQMGGGRYFAFEVDEQSILIKTRGLEPAIMKGVAIDIRIWVGEKPSKKQVVPAPAQPAAAPAPNAAPNAPKPEGGQ